MNSSMLAGERRWASARRGGMTVLGKVAVPKPLNLPSQRLENHGVDPNVEIVPKGTLSWGSRPSSSGSNPWMSSSLSPNAEGGTASPSHLSGRPSSGGSGTRPSTAGSERTQEPVANSWGSRPSSASGTLSSNQTSSTLLRPRSAENRPNSSQLSRFADPVSKTSSAWGTGGTADRLGVKSNKGDGFSLSSGDFPTLGTEKDNLMKNTELEDNVRPSSASGRIPHGKEYTRSQADERHGTVNTWSADGPEGAADDIHHPSMEKWHKDPQQFFNPNNTPQHFESWRGPPPMNSPVPAGVWYGGQHPRAPPFGAPPVRPGGFRMEPFPYYCPQIAPPPLADSQPGPPRGLRGPHSKNGDLYRPHMPDAYTRPGMPFRHGFYPGPPSPAGPMNFEGYYGPPPMGYEPDMSYMGVSGGPPAYNSSYLSPAPDIGNYHGRNGRGHHASKTLSEEEVAEDTEEPKRVTLKTRDQCDQREDGGTWEQHVQPDVPYPEKNRLPMISSSKNEWGAEEDANRGMPNENSPCYSDYRGHFADGVKVKSFEGMRNVKAVNDNRTNVSESVAPFPPEIPRVSLGSERDTSPVVTKNSALMHKIDCLNAKMRVPDGSKDLPSAYNRENERDRFKIIDTKTNKNTGKVTYTVGSFERTPASRDFVSGPHEVIDPVSDKPLQPVIAVSRRSHHGGQGRVDHHGEGKFNIQDADGWRKRPLTAESSSAITASHNEFVPSSHAHGSNNVDEASGISVINLVGKNEGDSIETHDSSDIQAQRVKMREIAKQRALQREKEEEERTREQRAKALAKLEELNRRTLAGEAGSGKSEKSRVITDVPGEQEDSRTVDKPVMVDFNNANQSGESVEAPRVLPVESDVSTLPAYEDTHDGNGRKIVSSQFSDSRHKRTVYKHRQNNSFQRSYTEKSDSNVPPGPEQDHTHVATNDINPHEHPSSEITPSESNMPNTSEAPASQRRKSNRSGKNKHKLDETPSQSITSDLNSGKESIENIEADVSLSNWESSFSTGIEPDRTVQAQDVLCSSLLNEESHNKATNQWRPHAPRRLPRNQHVNNKPHGGDTAVWAPVRTRNNAKGFADASPNSADESANSAKSTSNMVQNSLKGKRAEMERYVPKPVAKELAQQVNVPNSSSLISTSRSNDGSSGEVNEGDMSHIKHKKDQGTWKQRVPSDSFFMKSVHIVPSLTSEPKEIQEPKEVGQSVKNEIDPVNAEVKTSSNTEAVSKYHSVKGQGAGATGRGKRNGPKGPVTSIRNNTEPERTFSAEDVNQMDRTKENRTWQPKSSSNSENSHQGDGTKSLTMESNRFPKKEHFQHKTQPGQSVSVKSIVAQESNVGHRQEFEKKAKGGPYSPNQDQPVGPDEVPPVNEDVHLERNILSGSRKNDRQNNRSFRGHGNRNRGDWSASVHDNRPHNAPPFRDNRQKQNLHYEYQPVGPLKGNRPERVEEPNGADNLVQRHRERGQSHSRRGGNFNSRPSAAAAHLDSGWE